MLKNYVVLFLRNLRRQKLFSFINLMGLSVSIASTLLIYLYVSHELSYDTFHHHSDRLYRVNQTFIWAENQDQQFSRTGPGVANALKEELPEVELVTSLHTPGNYIISYAAPDSEIISFEEDKVFAADTNFFKVLNFPLIYGDEKSAFDKPNTLVMSRSTAEKYFGAGNPVGKMVRLGGSNGPQETFEVTGVTEDAPENSTIQFDVLLSMKNFPVDRLHWSWIWTQLETFVLLRPDADIESVRAKLVSIPRKRAEETLKRVMNVSYDEYIQSGKKWELFLQPISSLHLPSYPVLGSFPDSGNIKIIYSLVGSAIFIVLLSCINFMNLSAAQFTKRLKEASMRKIMGLSRSSLVAGYFFEALTFCLLAALVAFAICQMLIPSFNLLTGKTLSLNLFANLEVIIFLPILITAMAVLSSSYPAMMLNNLNPVAALKGKFKTGTKGKTLRDGLVVLQFSVSIILIICTAIVFQQLQFVAEKDLGFDKENLIEIEHVEAVQNEETFAEAVKNVPGVIEASWCTSTPPKIFGGDTFTAEGINFSLNYTSADENYLDALGLKLKHGRNFSANSPADNKAVFLNEAALNRLGWPVDESVIGKKFSYPGSKDGGFEIIGILPDFHYWALDADIEPLAIFNINNTFLPEDSKSYLAIRIQSQRHDDWEKTIKGLAGVWKQHAGDTPFEYGFIDEYFAEAFETQQKFGKVLMIMAILAITIACLGLLGMIVYAMEQRTKEIGIRKVSGATLWDILNLITRSYTKLVVIAFVLGAPVAYWLMEQWLIDFANRIIPSPWIFLITGIFTLAVALLIIGYHSFKAALTNPVEVLRDE